MLHGPAIPDPVTNISNSSSGVSQIFAAQSFGVMKLTTLIIRELEDQFVPTLQNCVNIAELRKIHSHIVKYSLSQSNFLTTKMIDICNINGATDYAYLLFHQIIEPNIFLYNAMIRAYTHNHLYKQALSIYKQILTYPQARDPIFPDKFTFHFVVKASAGLLCLNLGKQIHGHVCKCGPSSNSGIENSLIDMYTKCNNISDALKVLEAMTEKDAVSWNTVICGHAKLGQMRRARAVFDAMPHKTIVSWTALISGYNRIGCYADALSIFHQMHGMGVKPDKISIVSILPACAQMGALELGKWIHIFSERNGLLQKTCVCNAMMDMYLKCGSIDQAWQLFNQMSNRDVISWSTMIGGLANHGKAHEAIELFLEMQRTHVKPNSVTFLGLLSSCAHAGFVDEGLRYFESMWKEYHINPGVEHYGCVVDLLGRSGCLDQAVEFIKKMPMEPDSAIWGSLLSSSSTYGNLEVAVIAMEHLLELEPDVSGNYVLLSNIYAKLGKWEGVSRMRKLMKSKKMKRTPGSSLIEVNNMVQEFVSGDDSKPFSHEIYLMLELLALQQSRSNIVTAVGTEELAPTEFDN